MPHPNILLITTDQQRFDTIHAAGNPHIFTPHLNWLCDTGIRFSRAYTDCPVCMPARATIMTGVPAYRHGATGNINAEPIRGRATIPALLAAAGYETRAQGKMHFNPMRSKFGFETMELAHDYYRQRNRTDPELCGSQHGMGQNEMEPVIGSVDENHTLTRWVVDQSIDFLDTRDPERPFFLWTSISKPHPPFDPSLKFWELYRDLPMPEPALGDWSADWQNIPPGFLEPTAHLNNAFRFTPDQLARIRRAYYACITELDVCLGRLFAAMRERNLLRDTLIIFTSDHGEMLGDHGMGGKTVFLEPSTHVPLLIRPPGEWDNEPMRGTVCDRLATLQDILPTCLSAAGLSTPLPRDADGHDLLAIAAGQDGRARFFGQCGSQFGVVEGDWKYVFTSAGGGELLFNLGQDPRETLNLAPSEPARCRELRAALESELAAAGSPDLDASGHLKIAPARPLKDVRRWSAWPGFHGNNTVTDLLH